MVKALRALNGRLNLDIVMTLSRQIVSGVLQLGLVVIVSVSLGPESTGQFSVGLLLPTIMTQLFSFGISSSLVYFCASGKFEPQAAWSGGRDAMAFIAVFGSILGVLFILIMKDAIFPGVESSVLFVALAAFPFMLLFNFTLGLLQARGDFRALNASILSQSGVAMVLFLMIAVSGSASVLLFMVMVVSSYIPALIYSLYSASRHVPLLAPSSLSDGFLRPAFRYGLTAYAGNVVTFLSYRLDLLMVNALAGPAAAGVYSVAVRFVEQLWVLSSAFVTVVFPKMASMADNEASRTEYTISMARSVLWLTVTAAAILAIFANPLIFSLYGEDFAGAVRVIYLLLPGVVAMSFARILAHDLAARGLIWMNLAIALCALCVSLTGNLAFIPNIGVAGAAVATSGGYIFACLLHVSIQNRRFRVGVMHLFLPQKRSIVGRGPDAT